MVALVDCNNFYASCERVFNPLLRNMAVVIASNNDGCIIARSNEAKALGIPMGAPLFEWREFFEKNNVVIFSSNYRLYGNMSDRVMMTLRDYTPLMENYSIDEAFLYFYGCHLIDMEKHLREMREFVLQATGIPTSVGYAPTKALAKMANKIAKKKPELNFVYIIDTEEKRIDALKSVKVEDVWGIGRQHAERLHAIGVVTAWDFTLLPDEWVENNMAVVGYRLKRDLEGKPSIQISEAKAKKNIACTRSFETNLKKADEVRERVVTFANIISEKLRAQKSVCCSLEVFVITNVFSEKDPQYSNSIRITLPFPTNSSIEIAKFATMALQQIYRDGYGYKKAGVIAGDIRPANAAQISAFENSDPRHKKLMEQVDKCNRHYGSHKVRLAAQDTKRIHKMRQEMLSPEYTTRREDIIKVWV